MLESVHTGLQEPIVHISSQLQVQQCHISSLELAMVGELTQWKYGKCYKSAPTPFWEDWLLNIYPAPQSICQCLESKKHITHDTSIPVF